MADEFKECLQHELGDVTVPLVGDVEGAAPSASLGEWGVAWDEELRVIPEGRDRSETSDEGARQLAGMNPVDLAAIRDLTADLAESFYPLYKEAAKQMMMLPAVQDEVRRERC